MTKRRSGENDEEYLKRKMRKIERKLKDLPARSKPSTPPPPTSASRRSITAQQSTSSTPPQSPSPPTTQQTPPSSTQKQTPPRQPLPSAAQPTQVNAADEALIDPEPNQSDIEENDMLPEEFLIALGSEGEDKEASGPEIRPELASRWSKLISTGLGKEAREAIMKKYPTPSNFKSAEAPKMNPEILASLSEITIKRDKRINKRQNLTGKVMCALGHTLTSVLKGNINSKTIIEQVNDAAKLCAEIYYEDCTSRKFFALAGANPTIKEAVRESKPDEFLFGKDCAENIKAAQAIKKTGSQIKQAPEPTKPQTKPPPPREKRQGNWRGPPQQYRQQQRPRGGPRQQMRRYQPQQRGRQQQQHHHRARANHRR